MIWNKWKDENLAIDEQIIPSKTKFSIARQYNPKKPNNWGLKKLVYGQGLSMIFSYVVVKVIVDKILHIAACKNLLTLQ